MRLQKVSYLILSEDPYLILTEERYRYENYVTFKEGFNKRKTTTKISGQ